MSAWIESHQALSRHRKTIRAVALLKIHRHQFIGMMHELWWWGLDNVPMDGWLNGLSDAEIAAGAQWEGDPSELVRVLITAGFIDVDPNDEKWLHDWYSYAGKLLKRRADNAERMRDARAFQPSTTPNARAQHVHSTCAPCAPATVPNPTEQNRTPTEGAIAPPTEKPKKTKGVNLAPLYAAFTAAGLERPIIPKQEHKVAGDLLEQVGPDALVGIWMDIGKGIWPPDDKSHWMLNNRSFSTIAPRINNWIDFKNGRHVKLAAGKSAPRVVVPAAMRGGAS